jgi:hypothetical protein
MSVRRVAALHGPDATLAIGGARCSISITVGSKGRTLAGSWDARDHPASDVV